MEAKDTVMNYKECEKATHPTFPPSTEYERIAKAQAEISFKAGREEERNFILQNTDRDKRARLEGIREVVEWIESCLTNTPIGTLTLFGEDEWRAKKKEWGIK